MVLVGKAD